MRTNDDDTFAAIHGTGTLRLQRYVLTWDDHAAQAFVNRILDLCNQPSRPLIIVDSYRWRICTYVVATNGMHVDLDRILIDSKLDPRQRWMTICKCGTAWGMEFSYAMEVLEEMIERGDLT